MVMIVLSPRFQGGGGKQYCTLLKRGIGGREPLDGDIALPYRNHWDSLGGFREKKTHVYSFIKRK